MKGLTAIGRDQDQLFHARRAVDSSQRVVPVLETGALTRAADSLRIPKGTATNPRCVAMLAQLRGGRRGRTGDRSDPRLRAHGGPRARHAGTRAPPLVSEPAPLSIVYPANRKLPGKVRVFVDWIAEFFDEHGGIRLRSTLRDKQGRAAVQ